MCALMGKDACHDVRDGVLVCEVAHTLKRLCIHASVCVCVCVQACVFYSYLALSHLSLKISKDHCDFPPDYTPQLFNMFEDK